MGFLMGLAVGALGAASAAAAAPAVGRYDAQLCVSLSAAAPSCGAAEVEWQRDSRARVRVNDLSYRLQLHSSQVAVVLMHGAMQVDEFVAPFEWAGTTLQFADAARNARYELRLGERKVSRP
ncbi:MAG: hypothetical protein H7306_15585 [Bacteriovorax sp.]|nr:hypothetical protein [Rhizobacter sp.]